MFSTASDKTADHLHHQQAADHHHDQTKPSDHQLSKVKLAKSANHKCSTCAQCCFGTALLPAPLILLLNQEASTLVAISLCGVIKMKNQQAIKLLALGWQWTKTWLVTSMLGDY
jgi:hypothetical protein